MAEVVPTTFEHTRYVCENLREYERKAFDKLDTTPEHLITQEVARAMLCYTGIINDKPVIIVGARTDGIFDESAFIWAICSNYIDKCPITFLRRSKETLYLLQEKFRSLHGLVLADFGCSVKWLDWLGFKLSEPVDGIQRFELWR